MTQNVNKMVLSALIGLSMAVIVTACVKNDNKDGNTPVGDNTVAMVNPLQISQDGTKIKNTLVRNDNVAYKVIEKGWRFSTDRPASIRRSMEEDIRKQGCAKPNVSMGISYSLKLNKITEVPLSLGQSYQVPAGDHLVVMKVDNKGLCPVFGISFFASLDKNPLDTNVKVQKLACDLASSRPRARFKEAIVTTKPFEFSILDRRNSAKNKYLIAQREFTANPKRKTFCLNDFNNSQCETSVFSPQNKDNQFIEGYNTVCSGLHVLKNKTMDTRPANFVLNRQSPTRVSGVFSCYDESNRRSIMRRVRNCEVIYDHGKAIVAKITNNNKLTVDYSCASMVVNLDLGLSELSALPQVVYWNIYDVKRDQYIMRQWTRAFKDEMLNGKIRVRKLHRRDRFRSNIRRFYMNSDLRETLPNMRLVISDTDFPNPGQKAVGHIPLNDLLKSNPEIFSDSSRFKRRCR